MFVSIFRIMKYFRFASVLSFCIVSAAFASPVLNLRLLLSMKLSAISRPDRSDINGVIESSPNIVSLAVVCSFMYEAISSASVKSLKSYSAKPF